MKRRVLIAILVVCVLATAITLVACGEPKTNLEVLQEHISNRQNGLIVGADEKFEVSIVSSKGEEVFIADGVVGKQIEKTTLSVKPLDIDLLNKTYKYKLTGESGELEGDLIKDKMGITFAAELTGTDAIGKLKSVKILWDDQEAEIALTDVLEGKIDFNKALEVAYEAYKEQLDPEIAEKDFKTEVYIKVISNRKTGGEYFWFVSFMKDKDNYRAAVISLDGEVLNKREHTTEK